MLKMKAWAKAEAVVSGQVGAIRKVTKDTSTTGLRDELQGCRPEGCHGWLGEVRLKWPGMVCLEIEILKI